MTSSTPVNRLVLLGRRPPRRLVSRNVAAVTSERQVPRVFQSAPARTVWLALEDALVSALLAQAAAHSVRHWLLMLERHPSHDFNTLKALFERFVPPPAVVLPTDELVEVLVAPNRADLCIGGSTDEAARLVTLVRGDLTTIVVPQSDFEPVTGAPAPDFTRFEIADFGQTLRFGEYEAAFDAVLYEHDSEYRRRIKAKRLAEDQSFGASLRRLRKQKKLPRTSFPGVTAKTIARLERGEVTRPHPRTLNALAKTLGVPADEIGSF